MERLLRSVMQIGGAPEAEDCNINFWVLRDANLEFSEVDAALNQYLERWYRAQSAPPPFEIVREYFEKDDKIEVVDRLEEIKRAQFYVRTNYRAICKAQQDQQERRRVLLILREAAHIVEHGRNLDKPVGEKKVLRGAEDATAYVMHHLARVGRGSDDVTAADALVEFVKFQAAPRMQLGIPALDESFGGGGLPTPRLVVFGGAPGAGKTSLCVAIAHGAMQQGHPVAFLAVDEGTEGVMGRICKIEGVPSPKDPPTTEFAAQLLMRLVPKPRREEIEATSRIRALPFFINEVASIEQMTERLLRFAEMRKLDRAPVLVVDSLQKVRTRNSDNAPDVRQRVDSVIAACKQAVRRGVVVLATSELNRGAYRSKKVEEQVADMAATKESGAIEYGAQTLVILRAAQELDVVTVTTPKNRGGKHPSFRLRLDRERMSYTQVDDEAENSAHARIAADAEILKSIVRANPNIRTVRELRAACQAGGELSKHERIDAARAYLELHRVLVRANGVFALAVERSAADMIA